jgi:hypothetical protein
MKTGTNGRLVAPGARAAGISRSQISRYSIDSELLGELSQRGGKKKGDILNYGRRLRNLGQMYQSSLCSLPP